YRSAVPRALHSFPTRRSSDLDRWAPVEPRDRARLVAAVREGAEVAQLHFAAVGQRDAHVAQLLQRRRAADSAQRVLGAGQRQARSEEHTSELQSLAYLVCRLL